MIARESVQMACKRKKKRREVADPDAYRRANFKVEVAGMSATRHTYSKVMTRQNARLVRLGRRLSARYGAKLFTHRAR